RARRLERFFTQAFFATEQFTGIKGKLVPLEETIDGCERILKDEFRDYPESALYMIGRISEAVEKMKLSVVSEEADGNGEMPDGVHEAGEKDDDGEIDEP
ncbi:MAG: hypothetical protein OQK59_00615, partial [Chlorobium sp.]|nr:hypothetical protein [Chlorobium sp.]